MRQIFVRLFSAMYRATCICRDTSGGREQKASFLVDWNFVQLLRGNQEHLLSGVVGVGGGDAEAPETAPNEIEVRGGDAT